MMKRLWGDNYFGKNAEGKSVWTNAATLDGKTLLCFCIFRYRKECCLKSYGTFLI